MSRRNSNANGTLIVLALVVGLPIFIISKLVDAVGWITIIVAIVAVIALAIWYQHDKKQKRLQYLRDKYHDEEVVQKIMAGFFWQGQSEEQLKDAIGHPVEVDRMVLKTKTKEIWKYHKQGVNRFGLRLTVENGLVVGWDKKA
jgi:hypothetical protein